MVMTASQLSEAVADGSVDTVIVGFTDHYGRLVGKRFDAEFFLESALTEGTHACDYLFTVDMEMEPIEGYTFANWDKGYGDVHLVPEIGTLRLAGWTDRTAIVLCDVHTADHALVDIAPRSVLRQQTEAAAELGLRVEAASELEFFLYRTSYRDAHLQGHRNLEAAGWYVEDYHLLQGARVEDYVGAARRALKASSIPVENSKGEAAIGQHELNIRYAPVAEMADRHTVMKHGLKELADGLGVSVTFMAKPDADQPGNSCHLHLSLWEGDRNVFDDGAGGRTDRFRWFLGGWMRHTPDLMVMYAPTINAYKRYQDQSWAPTGLAWSTDNRTAGFRVVGSGPSLRIECRLPGADTNPYLAYAAALASGLDGIRNQIEPPAEFTGDVYSSDVERVPTSLHSAVDRFTNSTEAVRLLGRPVVQHYSHFFRSEVAAFDAAVTDWEQRRYFERI